MEKPFRPSGGRALSAPLGQRRAPTRRVFGRGDVRAEGVEEPVPRDVAATAPPRTLERLLEQRKQPGVGVWCEGRVAAELVVQGEVDALGGLVGCVEDHGRVPVWEEVLECADIDPLW